MATTLSLSLQAFPPPDKHKESLQYLIQRINEQRGSFRHVTEKGLEEEIRKLDTGTVESDEEAVAETATASEDAEIRKEEVTKARDEIRKQVVQATNDSRMALEFVSLLLSKHAPAAAQTTMSPELKQMVPLGSLGAELVQPPQVSTVEKHNERMAVIGWRMQSLNGAVNSLLNSASRLEEEMEREARYWEEVLSVKEKGWSLHRLPREKHTLGVRYGFAEAYSDFRDRGLAALRCDEDGSLSLDRGIRHKGDRRLRVRILRQGTPIGSNIRDSEDLAVGDSVEKEILKARDSLFDEELHHELDREARNLVNQGVRCIDGSIILPYESGKQIEISLVALGDNVFGEATSTDPTADAIAVALRILLSYAHRQNLQARSKMPLPIREQKPPRRIYALLKPILEHLQHQSYVESIRLFLVRVKSTLTAAGLDISFEKFAFSETSEKVAHTIRDPQNTMVDDVLRNLTSPPETRLKVTLTAQSTTFLISAYTALQPPHFGTNFYVTIQGADPNTPMSMFSMSMLPPHSQFTTLPTLEDHIIDLLSLSILQNLVSKNLKWHIVSTHDKSIARSDPKTRNREMISVILVDGKLDLKYSREGKQKASGTWTWYGDQPSVEQGVVDVFESLP